MIRLRKTYKLTLCIDMTSLICILELLQLFDSRTIQIAMQFKCQV